MLDPIAIHASGVAPENVLLIWFCAVPNQNGSTLVNCALSVLISPPPRGETLSTALMLTLTPLLRVPRSCRGTALVGCSRCSSRVHASS